MGTHQPATKYVSLYNLHVAQVQAERRAVSFDAEALFSGGLRYLEQRLQDTVISEGGEVFYVVKRELKRKSRDEKTQDNRNRSNESDRGDKRSGGNESGEQTRSKVKQVEEDSLLLDSVTGTLWTQQEKEVFFTALARFSIHDLQSIEDQLPGKSAVQILNYYNLLKRELQQKKDFGTRQHKSKKLLSYSNFPIAYEMDEYITELENCQARLISLRELNSETATMLRKAAVSETEDRLLVSKNLTALTDSIYWNNRLRFLRDDNRERQLYEQTFYCFPSTFQERPPVLEKLAHGVLEHLVARHLRSTIKSLLVFKLASAGSFFQNTYEDPSRQPAYPLTVTKDDMRQVLQHQQLSLGPLARRQVRNKERIHPLTITDYLTGLKRSLNLDVDNASCDTSRAYGAKIIGLKKDRLAARYRHYREFYQRASVRNEVPLLGSDKSGLYMTRKEHDRRLLESIVAELGIAVSIDTVEEKRNEENTHQKEREESIDSDGSHSSDILDAHSSLMFRRSKDWGVLSSDSGSDSDILSDVDIDQFHKLQVPVNVHDLNTFNKRASSAAVCAVPSGARKASCPAAKPKRTYNTKKRQEEEIQKGSSQKALFVKDFVVDEDAPLDDEAALENFADEAYYANKRDKEVSRKHQKMILTYLTYDYREQEPVTTHSFTGSSGSSTPIVKQEPDLAIPMIKLDLEGDHEDEGPALLNPLLQEDENQQFNTPEDIKLYVPQRRRFLADQKRIREEKRKMLEKQKQIFYAKRFRGLLAKFPKFAAYVSSHDANKGPIDREIEHGDGSLKDKVELAFVRRLAGDPEEQGYFSLEYDYDLSDGSSETESSESDSDTIHEHEDGDEQRSRKRRKVSLLSSGPVRDAIGVLKDSKERIKPALARDVANFNRGNASAHSEFDSDSDSDSGSNFSPGNSE